MNEISFIVPSIEHFFFVLLWAIAASQALDEMLFKHRVSSEREKDSIKNSAVTVEIGIGHYYIAGKMWDTCFYPLVIVGVHFFLRQTPGSVPLFLCLIYLYDWNENENEISTWCGALLFMTKYKNEKYKTKL